MSKANQKQTFLGGAAVLALATAIVKVIGACYKLPLQQVIGIEGYGYFTTAYDIYTILLMVSTTGLPVAMSRMISQAKALGRANQVRRVFTTSMYVFLTIGVIGSCWMFFFCHQWAAWMEQPEAWFAIKCLAPAVFFLCLISALRGFFQGQSNMIPTSVSQIFEALSKLVIGLGAAYLIMQQTGSVIYASGGAILGVTIGTVIAAAYLAIRRLQALRSLDDETKDPHVDSFRKTMKTLLSIALPITLGAAGLQIISVIDAKLVMHQLKNAAGFTDGAANTAKGIYNFTQTIFNLPCAFITPLTVSIIPAITEHLTQKNRRGVRMVEESALRVMSLIALPCAVGLVIVSGPILQLLGGYEGENLQTGTALLSILGPVVFFNSLVLVTNAMMQAHGFVFLPVVNMFIGGVVKVIVNYILVGNPAINIVGAPVGTLVCYVVITGLNIFTLGRVLKYPPKLFANIYKALLASLLMGAAAFLTSQLLSGMSAMVRCVGSIAVAGVIYIILVLFLKVLTVDDYALLPKGEKIAKILRIR